LTGSSFCWRGGAARSSVAATANGFSRSSTAAPRLCSGSFAGSRTGRRQWQRDRLAAIKPVLSPEWLARYRDLVTEFGAAPEQPATLPAIRSFAIGSPVTAGDLAATSTEDLVELLVTWEPPGGLLGADRHGLASALHCAIRQDAARRSSAAEAFTGLRSVYVEAVISAFWLAAQEGAALDWPAVLSLCSWADQQAEAELRVPGDRVRRQWEPVRMASLRLLEAGFAASGHEIPAELGGQAWAVIENAAADPDPDPEAEAKAQESGQPLGEIPLAHIRPKALTTALAYAAWLRLGNPGAGLGAVQQFIETQIDPAQPKPSRAVRWVCGASFGELAALFQPWAVEKAPVIFPLGEAERGLWTAAWDGYLDHRPDPDMCEVLDGSYQLAVNSLDPDGEDRAELARATNLGLHLIIRYWHGRLSFDKPRPAAPPLLPERSRSSPGAPHAVPGPPASRRGPCPRRQAHPLVGGKGPGRARRRRPRRTGVVRGMVRGRETRRRLGAPPAHHRAPRRREDRVRAPGPPPPRRAGPGTAGRVPDRAGDLSDVRRARSASSPSTAAGIVETK
jgi:hypothetical protein